MKSVQIGIIGGTGIGERLLALGGTPIEIDTPYGTVAATRLPRGTHDLILFSRHSAGHKVPPHRVNYRGLASAMKQLEVTACISTAAVGSLNLEWGPGTLVLCDDFLDFTARNLTMFDETVEHRDFSDPFGPAPRAAISAAAAAQGVSIQPKGTYLCANGPRYETPAEIRLYQQWGADVVGMTAASEAILMREANVPYACVAIVTNFGCGLSSTPLDHSEVVDEMLRTGETVVTLLLAAAERMASA